MIKCFECGELAEHNHHVVPRSLGGTKTIPLCLACHGKVHSKEMHSPTMIREGVARARAAGASWGAPVKVTPELINEAKRLRESGRSYKDISKLTGLSVGSVHSAVNKQ